MSVSQTRLLVILVVAVCCVVFAAHWPALSAQATSFDDDQYLLDNRLVQNPGFKSAWRFLSEVLKPSTVEGYYQPLAMISLMLDCALGGGPDNLLTLHLTSLCLHAANTILIIIFLYMLFGSAMPAVLVGLLFGVHPLTVEPIPWIGERKTLLAAFFALWTLFLYIAYARKPNWKLFTAVTFAYLLALLSKPTVTFLPLLLVLLDFWPLRRLGKKTLLEKIPLLVLMVVFAVITVVSQIRAAGLVMPGQSDHPSIPFIFCHNIIFYPSKILWPVNLSSHYPFPAPFTASNPVILTGVIGTCVLLVILLLSLCWTRAFVAGWLFFMVAILPTMQVFKFSDVIASDKYAYFPSVGLLIVLTWLLSKLWDFARSRPISRIIIVAVILSLAAAESVATHRQSLRWRTTETLYKYMLGLTPNVASLHYNYGFYLYNQGRLDDALQQFTEELRLAPNDYRIQSVVGIVYSLKGRTETAIACWQKALMIEPNCADALNNLAWVKATNEDARFRNPDEALSLALRACSLTDYNQPDFLDTLAAAYAAVGKFQDAVETAQKAVNIAQAAGKEELTRKIKEHLDLYLTGRPYSENHPYP